MDHARHAYNPPDFHVEPSHLNPWTDPSRSEEDGVRSRSIRPLCGTPRDVAEQVAELATPASTTALPDELRYLATPSSIPCAASART